MSDASQLESAKLLGGFLSRIAHHKPVGGGGERIRIQSRAMPEQLPGTIAYEIVGDTAADVQREIDRLMGMVEEKSGAGEFRTPVRVREEGRDCGKYRSRGYTRVVEIAEAAE